jgi:hypothetical protein
VNPWFNRLASISLVGLLFLCLAWELWLAPLRPGGSMLALKALPLLFPVFGILRGKRYTHQWTSLLSLVYVAEGAVRAFSDQGASQDAGDGRDRPGDAAIRRLPRPCPRDGAVLGPQICGLSFSCPEHSLFSALR